MSDQSEDRIGYARLMDKAKQGQHSVRDYDLDAFADGMIAHREGKQFHECPHDQGPSLKGISWRSGWNERALWARDR